MCECCDKAREAPEFAQFAVNCLHCAARLIQHIQRRLMIPAESKRERCRAVIARSLEYGLSEIEVRRLAKLPEPALAPETKEAHK